MTTSRAREIRASLALCYGERADRVRRGAPPSVDLDMAINQLEAQLVQPHNREEADNTDEMLPVEPWGVGGWLIVVSTIAVVLLAGMSIFG